VKNDVRPENHLVCGHEDMAALHAKLACEHYKHSLLCEPFFLVLQIETSLLTHWWYKTNFKDYPATRKAIIPYVL